MSTRDTALTANEIDRLMVALANLKRVNYYPGCEDRIEDIRCLVLWPNIEAWNKLHKTALDSRKTLSLWQAICLTSTYPAVVPIDQYGKRYWKETPDACALLLALEYAFA